ncbi:MAG: HEAT repeat domain-containing protein [Candidatus Nealsonbacteria bacterium]|nr:HEAT repeat domain-containing protein [Candidatus Nealsonbacteria bacterium]
MEYLGLDAAPAVPHLIQLLDAPDKGIRAAAADTLGAIGKDATAAIPKLVERLGEGDLPRISTELPVTDVGAHAAFALGTMGKDAVAHLTPCLTNKRSAVRSNTVCALDMIGPDAHSAVTSLIGRLKDRDWLVRQCAAQALGSIRSRPNRAIPALVESLKDKNFNVRRCAAAALGAFRPTTPTALEALSSALHDEEGNVQHEAAEALANLGNEAVPAVPALADALKSREMYIQGHPGHFRPVAETAARALGAIGPPATNAMPALLDLVRDRNRTFQGFTPGDNRDNYEARGEAAIAAARIDPQSDEVVRVLGQSLQFDVRIRQEVAIALALVGPKARGTVPTLIRLSKPDRRFCHDLNCACAAVAIEPDNPLAVRRMLDCFPPVPGPFDDDDWALLRTALARAGAASRPAIPVLIRLVEDVLKDQENAARTLATFGPEAQSAIPALLDLLTSRQEHPRQEAIEALQQIASEKSVPLLAALKDPDANVRSGVVEVLGYSPRALPLVMKGLDDPSARVRLAALMSLAKLESSAAPAVPQIRRLLQADSRAIREAAVIVLQKVEKR